jgi:hypothetical protein
MKDNSLETGLSEEYGDEDIIGDGYLAYIAERLQRIGSPAVEVVRSTNRKLAIGAAIGGTLSLAAGTAIGGYVFSRPR